MEALIILEIFFATRADLKIGEYLANKPLQAAGMSADNVRGWEIVRKMNIWPRSEASRANNLGYSLVLAGELSVTRRV